MWGWIDTPDSHFGYNYLRGVAAALPAFAIVSRCDAGRDLEAVPRELEAARQTLRGPDELEAVAHLRERSAEDG